jgi:hypothetical protein
MAAVFPLKQHFPNFTIMSEAKKGLTLVEAIRQDIWEEISHDETVFVIGSYGGEPSV